MSDKSGVSEQIISLPQGGGAVKGLGETFSPDLHTGTGNFSVPLALPPGRNGFQPQLNLVYSTGNGNGPFGLGWSLSVPGVSRKTSKGVPRYDDQQDIFILSGAEDLIPVIRLEEQTRYQPRTEGLFARIIHYHRPGDNYWEVRSKDGLTSFYGTPGAAPDDPAVIANPAHRANVFAWNLSRTVDPFGNRIEYTYLRDTGQTESYHWDQLYLRQIRYVDYLDPDSGEECFLISVTFHYDEPATERPDPFSDYRAGFEIRTRRRCQRITIQIHAGVETLARSYDFLYLDERVAAGELPATMLPLNGVSLLSQIKVSGHDGNKTEALPPLEFGYTRFEPAGRKFSRVQGVELPSHSLGNADLELVDLFGNGLPDIIQMNGVVRYWRNLGGGRFDRPRQMAQAPAGLQLADPGVQMLDANGDGRADLLVTSNGMAGYFSLNFAGSWDRRSFQRYRAAPSFNLEDPEVKLLDLDGDGVTDALRSGSRLECFFNDPQEGWNETRRVERQALDLFPNVTFSDPHVKLADMSGDGLQDIVLVYDGCVQYWANLGYGAWAPRVSMRRNPRFPWGYNPQRVLLGDVDGDGLADLLYIDDNRVTLWLNQGGNSWSDPIEIKGTPPVSDMDAVRLVDLNGDGIGGLLWSADATGLSQHNMAFLDFTGGVKPYLLNEMNNHMGAITRIQYAPSTQFYLADQARPETGWQTPLPFPVQVVAQVEVIDQLSQGKLTTLYRYHHGYWDGHEREFRGFGMVEQLDTETFEPYHQAGLHGAEAPFTPVAAGHFSPPTLTKTWFHQGPVEAELGDWAEVDYGGEYWPGDPSALPRPQALVTMLQALPRPARRDALRALRGSVLRTELYALDGTERQDRPYTVTESLYGLREETPPGPDEAERLRLFFPHLLAQRTIQWERGDEPMTQMSFTDEYDIYGQPGSQVAIAVPRGRDFRAAGLPGEPYLATQTVTSYANRDEAGHYLIGRVARTTSYELLNDGSPSVLELHTALLAGLVSRRLFGQALNFYDGPAFVGLPFGQLGDHGALSRSESLVLTEEILREAYRSGATVQSPPEIPPYLVPETPPAWTNEYPAGFRDRLPPLAGYSFRPGGPDSPYARGYFVVTERRRYDCQENPDGQGRGLLTATRDPLGRDTAITYDGYQLLPVQVTGPTGLATQAVYDYRVLQPVEVTDPNGNRAAVAFTPLGLVERSAVMGKPGEDRGDTLAMPGSRLIYDFRAFIERNQPVSVRTIRRVHHANDRDVPLSELDETIETVEYSDGFGRLLQSRTQAEAITFGDPIFGNASLPADQAQPVGEAVGQLQTAEEPPRVVVSGWQLYDNKGQVVEKYEPFFATGFAYNPPQESAFGQKVTMFYDPRGQVIRTLNPDGSEQRVILGIPANLADPENFTPTPWESYSYDANDNAGRTHGSGNPTHWNTPASLVVDALGRTIMAVARNGQNPEDWFITRSSYDIQGNLLTVTDALGRVAFQHVYDLAQRPLRIENIDAGVRRTVLDALGSPIESRDSKAALILHAYDPLNRPIRLWARDAGGEAVTLREHLVYGDSPDVGLTGDEARAANLLGKLYERYDEAGRLAIPAYDFKGNLLEKSRQAIADAPILSVFEAAPANAWQVQAFRVDWQPPEGTSLAQHAAGLLETTPYTTSLQYDGLNRVKLMRYPQDVTGERKTLQPAYNRAGALERVMLDGAVFVERIAYNAKGQRTLIAYGNGVMTRYAYDPRTFRLARLRTERYTQPEAHIYRPAGVPLQDFAYGYDLVGNITAIHDRTPGSGILNTPLGEDALDRTFSYDPLYRLLLATGRETAHPPLAPWEDTPRSTDLTQARAYTERYEYDSEGNLLRLAHQANGGGFTRDLALAPGGNRLATVRVGDLVYDYTYDANGNLRRETTSRHFDWDYADRLRSFRSQAPGAEPSVHAHYLYDAAGQRVKKLVRKQGGRIEVTLYLDGLFEQHRIVQGNNTQENTTLHVMDNQSRIALVRVGPPFPGDATPAVRVHLGDHLGSSNLVIDQEGSFINREEYTPYGETSFGSFARKRYRFTGKERDEESGLYYHGARYYAPWLARWVSCDPLSEEHSFLSSYYYSGNNPELYVDKDGKNFGLYVDHNKRTITIKATYYTEARLTSILEPAIEFWNNKSGKYAYVLEDRRKDLIGYTINFDLNYVVVDDSPDQTVDIPFMVDGRQKNIGLTFSESGVYLAASRDEEGNAFFQFAGFIDFNEEVSGGEYPGVTVDDFIIDVASFSDRYSILDCAAHEIGHTLIFNTDGEHSPLTIMNRETKDLTRILSSDIIDRILASAELGPFRKNERTRSISRHETGNAPKKFQKGMVFSPLDVGVSNSTLIGGDFRCVRRGNCKFPPPEHTLSDAR